MITAAPPFFFAEGIQQRQLFPEEESIAVKRAVNCEGKRAPYSARLPLFPPREISAAASASQCVNS